MHLRLFKKNSRVFRDIRQKYEYGQHLGKAEAHIDEGDLPSVWRGA